MSIQVFIMKPFPTQRFLCEASLSFFWGFFNTDLTWLPSTRLNIALKTSFLVQWRSTHINEIEFQFHFNEQLRHEMTFCRDRKGETKEKINAWLSSVGLALHAWNWICSTFSINFIWIYRIDLIHDFMHRSSGKRFRILCETFSSGIQALRHQKL